MNWDRDGLGMDYLVHPSFFPFLLSTTAPGRPLVLAVFSLLSFSLSFLFILQRQGKAINFFSLFFPFFACI